MEQSPSWEDNRSSASQEIPHVLWNPKVHYWIHESPPPVPILSHIHPGHTIPSHLLKIRYNSLGLIWLKMEMVTYLQLRTVFWICGKITSINYGIYVGLTVIVRQIHTAEPLVLQPASFEDEFLRKSSQGMKCQKLIKFWQMWSKQKRQHSVLMSTNLLQQFHFKWGINAIAMEGI
jgi:hypothetical protein